MSHEIRGIGGLNTFNNTNINATYVTDDNQFGLTFFGQLHHRSPYDRNGDGYSEMPKLDGNNVGLRGFARLTDLSRLTAELHNTREFRRGGDRFDSEPHDAHTAEQLRHNNLTGSFELQLHLARHAPPCQRLCLIYEGTARELLWRR